MNERNVGLSVVVPAYNEAERITKTLRSIGDFSQSECNPWRRQDLEVIVSCDGCTDATADVVRSLDLPCEVRILNLSPNRGKGHAVRAGVLASAGDYVLTSDADGSTPIEEVVRLAEPVLTGKARGAIASRRMRDSQLDVRQPVHRRALGAAFSLYTRWIVGLPFRDTQCGFKLFEGGVGRELFAALKRFDFAYDVALLAEAGRRGVRIAEVGVTWRDDPRSTVAPLRDGIRMLRAGWTERRGWRPRHAATPSPAIRVGV